MPKEGQSCVTLSGKPLIQILSAYAKAKKEWEKAHPFHPLSLATFVSEMTLAESQRRGYLKRRRSK